MSSSNSTCIHCGETYGQHDPAPRLLASQARLMPATSTLNAMVGQTTPTATHVPLPPSSLSLPTPLSRATPQPGPPQLPLRLSQLPISQSTLGRAPFYSPGPSTANRPFGVAPTTGPATALPYSMYAATPPHMQVLGKRKRARGRASQLLTERSASPRRYELRVVVDCQAVSCECDFLLLISNDTWLVA